MNLDKGSWQNISVTLVKGLALKVGPRGICTNVATARGGCGESCGPSGRSFGGVEDKSFRDLLPSAVNNHLRTGAEKGNPTF